MRIPGPVCGVDPAKCGYDFVGSSSGQNGVDAAGRVGAGSAQAAPGISYQNGSGNEIGLGDHGEGKSADAKATGANSQALAINTGLNLFGKSASFASADGGGATAVSIDGYTAVTGSNTHGFAALGQTNMNGADNNAVTVAGQTNLYDRTDNKYADNVHGNFVVNFGGSVQQAGQRTTDAGELSLSACGTSVSGQAAHIKVSPGGLC
jgi:hypothetical protein